MSLKKSNFSVTCSLLSQYLKEKRSLGDLGVLEMASRIQELNKGLVRPTTTMSLLPGVDISTENQPDATETDSKNQLTIFYDGKVLVYDNFPAAKAKDLMKLAAKEPFTASNVAGPLPESCPSTYDSDLSDLPMPIARRASLHRFFAKRNDRIISKAPYQVNCISQAEAYNKAEETPWCC